MSSLTANMSAIRQTGVPSTVQTVGILSASCPPNCRTCSEPTFCTACFSGFYLSYGACASCRDECLACYGHLGCTSCKKDYTLKDGVCEYSNFQKLYITVALIVIFLILFVVVAIWCAHRKNKAIQKESQEKFGNPDIIDVQSNYAEPAPQTYYNMNAGTPGYGYPVTGNSNPFSN